MCYLFYMSQAIGNLWSICLGVNILRLECPKKPVPLVFIGNIYLSKALRTLSLHS